MAASPIAVDPGPQVEGLRRGLEAILDAGRILDRPLELVAHAHDASFYRLIPKAVVYPRDIDEVRRLFRFSQERRIPMTFRTAGTSLSGQAVSDGLLVEVARHFRGVKVEEGGKKVRVQPGVIGGHVNLVLRPYGAKMGPDPASINACMLGGILSNNSSGMCCGVVQNAYHTLDTLTFLLPSGTLVETARADADEQLRAKEPALHAGLRELKREIEKSPALVARIRAKYRMKNTTGYSINAFLDFERPVDMLAHLMIGGEGTLGFIAEAVLNTVPDYPVKYTALLSFADLHAACAAIVPLRDAGAKALELMDRASLRAVEDQPGMPPELKGLPDAAASLLAEFQCENEAGKPGLERAAAEAMSGLRLLLPTAFTFDPVQQNLYWHIRKGAFPSIGAVRKSGTAVIIEDVTFPVERLADAAVDLTRLFRKHGYPEAVIFGHAKDGNLHFVITQSFQTTEAVLQYEKFMDDVVELVVGKYDGALKAEHGTGRNVAPFVVTEWGPEAYGVMKRLKALVDPWNLLNPGVILNPDKKAHVRDLKPMPTVEEEVDKCTECGFCESMCPSRDLTLTPRQRIVVNREMKRLRAVGGSHETLEAIASDYPYQALKTCATDGLCATACPVGIDTGKLVKRFRREGHGGASNALATLAARRFRAAEAAVRLLLRLGHLGRSTLGNGFMVSLTKLLRAVGGDELPVWLPEMPRPARALPRTSREGAGAVYFAACMNRVMGRLPDEPGELSLPEALVRVAERAGVPLWIPGDLAGTCCGVPFASKGYDDAHHHALNGTVERLWAWSDQGRLPVVVDMSPCTYGLVTTRSSLTPENQLRFDRLRILDAVAFAADQLVPRLGAVRKAGSVALHPVCSLIKLGLAPKLEVVAKAAAETAFTPREAGCCGFAGDRGLSTPELNASATREEVRALAAASFDGCYSSSRTCEVGLAHTSGRPWRSIIHLLEEAIR
jgi:D-lactate dehydrogenase